MASECFAILAPRADRRDDDSRLIDSILIRIANKSQCGSILISILILIQNIMIIAICIAIGI